MFKKIKEYVYRREYKAMASYLLSHGEVKYDPESTGIYQAVKDYEKVTVLSVHKDHWSLQPLSPLPEKHEGVRMPIQPIVDGRFVPNRIVLRLLACAPIDLNGLSCISPTQQEEEQFAQLIGYSLNGFSGLSYVSDETLARVKEGEPDDL